MNILTQTLRAWHGRQDIKDEYVARMKAHIAADELLQGYGYWKKGKGCAVGCTIHSDRHKDYEGLLGYPEALARIQDKIFEGMPEGEHRKFPLAFLEVVRPGANLYVPLYQYLHTLLSDPEHGAIRYATTDRSKKAVEQVITLYERALVGEDVPEQEWRNAADAADAAYDAYAAVEAAVAHAVAHAVAYAAAAVAAAVAHAVAYAAAVAADAAAAVAAYAAYAADARKNHYSWQAKTLLKFLEEA